jgi:hypothetical protein
MSTERRFVYYLGLVFIVSGFVLFGSLNDEAAKFCNQCGAEI